MNIFNQLKVELTGRQTGYKLLKSALKESNQRMYSVKVFKHFIYYLYIIIIED